MTGLFNGTCEFCGVFRPRCAKVQLRVDGKAQQYHPAPRTMCDVCRLANRGKFRQAPKSKGIEHGPHA